MKHYPYLLIILTFFSCNQKIDNQTINHSGTYHGIFEYGNFSDKITFTIEKDSAGWKAFFTSMAQNANRIPFQNIEVNGDSINFMLRSDFFTYTFNNKWENNNKLRGELHVDTVAVKYTLTKESSNGAGQIKSEDISFLSGELTLSGTIWYPEKSNNKALVIVTSSGGADRSASAAEARLFAQMGFTTFHYDKRGTGISEGDWMISTIEELSLDDINAINFFSTKTGFSLSDIGIKGSSQGATKIPYILNQLEDLSFGISVSCPGVTLLESDLNYWVNRNIDHIGAQDIEEAKALQGKVFRHIAGELPRPVLEKAISAASSKPWFEHIWVPDLDEVKVDKKLLYTPIPHFEKVKQPILLIQGSLDEIIPDNSYQLIANAMDKGNISQYEIVILEGANHSMYFVGESDFPYWSKLHADYLNTIEGWVNTN